MNDSETIVLAQHLVRIDSVNPSLVPGAAGEAEIASFIHDFLSDQGISAEQTLVLPGRPNVIATLPGGGDGPSLLLCCHMDTVSVAGMSEPFSGRIEEGRLIGRGSQDVKGGLAAMLAALVELSRLEARGGDIIAVAVADEEAYSEGTQALLRSGVGADVAIVFEPTDLDVAIAHKGFVWAKVETRGVAAHGSRPAEGVDAIAHMGRVLRGLEELGETLLHKSPHPVLGNGSVHASTISGGRELSSYPEHCLLELERRTVPGESEETLRSELEAIISSTREQDPSFDASFELSFSRRAYQIASKEPLPQELARAAERRLGRKVAFTGMTGWTDSALLGDAGIPSVVFGPGGQGLHGLDEHGKVEDICACRDILVDFAKAFCQR